MAICNSRTVLAEIHGKLCQKGKKKSLLSTDLFEASVFGHYIEAHSKTEKKSMYNVISTSLEQKRK